MSPAIWAGSCIESGSRAAEASDYYKLFAQPNSIPLVLSVSYRITRLRVNSLINILEKKRKIFLIQKTAGENIPVPRGKRS
ncbi:MAG: hypothetical protein BCS36_01100 [Desulfovibrio sp. MES5]|uniref:hypothetical protein n=1 Tax=Desulfovibrio sp. MES5 TaxID=1899016 RepID=UPI000B9D11FB|nr:hypothetical protein [Desulfovibrio sp. MES5]OXS28314.1 MAG: hypothetical protein BCS36_01100 [Desulfovibrio sp. MES5]